MNFQSMIAILHQFWGARGCPHRPAYDIERRQVPRILIPFKGDWPEPGQLPMLNLAAAPRMGVTVKTLIASNTITSTKC